MQIYKNRSVDAVKPTMMLRADVKSVVAEPVKAGAAGAAGVETFPAGTGVLAPGTGVTGTCATVVASLPAGQVVHSTLTTLDAATEAAPAGAVTVMAFASETIDDATTLATLAPEAVAMLAIVEVAVTGQVTTSDVTGHVGQCTSTVVIDGAGGGVTALQLRHTGA